MYKWKTYKLNGTKFTSISYLEVTKHKTKLER